MNESATEISEKQVALNAASRYVAMVLTMGTGLVLVPFLIHSLGNVMYGLQALSNQVLQLIGMIALANMLSYEKFATAHYARGEFDAMNSALSVGFAVSLGSALLYLAGTVGTVLFAETLLGIPPDLVGTARIVMLVIGLASAAHMVMGVWKAPVFMLQKFYIESAGSVVSVVGGAVTIWAAFQLLEPSIVLAVTLASAFRVGSDLFVVIPWVRKSLPEMKVGLGRIASRRQILEMTTFGWANFLGVVGYMLYYSTDTIIISNLDELGLGKVAYYTVAQRWDPQIRMLIGAFIGVLSPLLVSDIATGNRDRVRRTFLRASRYGLVLALFPCALLAFLAVPFFRIWLDPSFVRTSVPVLRLILAGIVVSLPGIVGYEILYANGKIRRAVAATLVGGLLNVGLSIGFVKWLGWGLLGVAAGSVLSLSLVNGVYIPWMASRMAGVPVGRWFRESFAGPLAALLPLAGICLVFRRYWEPAGWGDLLIQFALAGGVYAGAVWTIGLRPEDREKARRGARWAWERLRELRGRAA